MWVAREPSIGSAAWSPRHVTYTCSVTPWSERTLSLLALQPFLSSSKPLLLINFHHQPTFSNYAHQSSPSRARSSAHCTLAARLLARPLTAKWLRSILYYSNECESAMQFRAGSIYTCANRTGLGGRLKGVWWGRTRPGAGSEVLHADRRGSTERGSEKRGGGGRDDCARGNGDAHAAADLGLDRAVGFHFSYLMISRKWQKMLVALTMVKYIGEMKPKARIAAGVVKAARLRMVIPVETMMQMTLRTRIQTEILNPTKDW